MRTCWFFLCGVGLMACTEPRVIGEDAPDWSSWDDAPTGQRVDVSIATWNIQELGAPGSTQYDATLEVLRRLDADIVGLNEVLEDEVGALAQLAADAGYSVVVSPPAQPFGSIGNAMLSRFEARLAETPDGASLSSDATARDMTRRPVVFTTGIPGTDTELTVVVQHWKSGFDEDDFFRRAVDAERTAQAAARGTASDFLVVMGDVNEDVVDLSDEPRNYERKPSGLPDSYRLGADIEAMLDEGGLVYRPFGILEDLGLQRVDAEQRDGTSFTRPSSERRLDYMFVSSRVQEANLQSEVYNTRHDDGGGLATGGVQPGVNANNRASDHLPVMVRFSVSEE